MYTTAGHLTYCTNIHPGETWSENFKELKNHFPLIKEKVSSNQSMGIGLRLSNEASLELIKKQNQIYFKEWLDDQQAYIFTINGFPYGEFHGTIVKDQVHSPDWTKQDRVDYTIRLFHILSNLIPEGLDGGVSTSPLSYMPWFSSWEDFNLAKEKATKNVIIVIEELIQIYVTTGKVLHLDIEPEPGGMLSNGTDFIEWFEKVLLPIGIPYVSEKFLLSQSRAEHLIKEHLRLCYDICHFAVNFEDHMNIIAELERRAIKIGKLQISAALKAEIDSDFNTVQEELLKLNEPTYLHQVVSKTSESKLLHFTDLPNALKGSHSQIIESRAHFHVPVFTEKFGLLSSTNDEIKEVLLLQKEKPFTHHLEVETYTWDILPRDLKLPLADSVVRELQWVNAIIDKQLE